MRIKKKEIIEAAASTNSSTTQQVAKSETQTTNPEEIKKLTDAIKELDKEMEETPFSAFMTKVNENRKVIKTIKIKDLK